MCPFYVNNSIDAICSVMKPYQKNEIINTAMGGI